MGGYSQLKRDTKIPFDKKDNATLDWDPLESGQIE
jgi:hypothetical protein